MQPRELGPEELEHIETAARLAGIAIEHQRFVEDLHEAKDTAEAANRFKSSFLAAMSHEIRTPMTAILGYADMLLDPRQTTNERTDCIQIIRQNGTHLLTILNDILDLSKIEAGKLEVEKIPCSPCKLVDEVTSLLHARAKEKGLDFQVQYLGAIPEVIRSDPTRLRQILLNLVGNAIKFTSSGGVLLAVNLLEMNEDVGSRLCFEVIDTGPGVSEAHKKQLFRPYHQGDSSVSRKFGGTGLGLVISKRLAEILGGDICVQSSIGEGTSFIVSVDTGPLDGVRLLSSPGEERLLESMPAQSSGASLPRLSGRILLAEDYPVNQRLISYFLQKAGLTVAIAENGRIAADMALDAARPGGPFDLIFMDMQMPVLDGLGATAELRAKGYTGPIVALTASAMTSDRERCRLAGCTAFLSKPIEYRKLIETTGRYISGT